MKHIFVALAIFAVCFLQSTYAIKCYQCRSWTDADCDKDHYASTSKIVDCDTQSKPSIMEQYNPVTKCNKIVTKDGAGVITSRDCHFEVVGHKPEECTVSKGRELISCKVCKDDLCNGSSGAGRLASVGIFSLLAFLIMKFVL